MPNFPSIIELTGPSVTNSQFKSKLSQLLTATIDSAAEELDLTSNLNTLEAGNYFLSTSNLNALVNAGDFTTLGYPADTVKSGAVKINVVRKNNFTYQTLEFPQQGRILTRQGAIGSSFTPWVSGASDAIKHTDNELNKKFGSIGLGESLNDYVNHGQWGISGTVVLNGSQLGDKGYPSGLIASTSKLDVVRTAGGYSVQTLLNAKRIFKRILVASTKEVYEDWIELFAFDALSTTVLINQEVAKKFGTVTAGTSLNTFINAGTWGISGGIVAADSKNAELGYPAVLTASSAVLTVAQTASNYAIQELTHGTKKYKRILNRANGSVFEDWSVVGGDTITDYAKKGVVANLKDLNTYIDEGVFACTSAVMKSGIKAGNLNYPTFFESIGGGLLIVSKSGNYPYQVFIATRQKKIAVRQGESATSYLPWVNMLDIVPVVKKTFLAFGSSSFYYMSAKIKTMIESFNATYISDAIGGQILETMQAHQGSNPISIVFNDGVTALNNVASAVTVTQKDDFGSLIAKGSFTVTLSNGLKGTLNLDANTFTASNATEIYNVGSLSFDVDFGYFDYAQTAYHIFNIGKNNITMGSYTAQQVIDETNKMIDFIKNKGNQNFIVGGHFVDRGMTAAKKQVVLDVNAALKAKHGLKYFDMQDYLMSSQIWTDLNITPTQDDLDKQAAGELAVSLSRDAQHLSADVDVLIVERLKQKLLNLGYLS